MTDELSELDELIESDVLEALGEKVAEDSSIEIDGITIEDMEPNIQEDLSITEPLEDKEIQDEIIENETLNEENIKELNDIPTEELGEFNENVEQQAIQESNETTINTTDLASLLSQLLNNKTIEITIKIKD